MNCEQIRQSLGDYVDGSLPSDRRAQVDAHLTDCPACRRALAEHRAVWAALDAWPAPKASEDFNRRFWPRAEQEAARPAARPRRARRLWVWSPVFAAAAAVLVVALIVTGGQDHKVAPNGLPVAELTIMQGLVGESGGMSILGDEDLIQYIEAFEVLAALEPEDWASLVQGGAL